MRTVKLSIILAAAALLFAACGANQTLSEEEIAGTALSLAGTITVETAQASILSPSPTMNPTDTPQPTDAPLPTATEQPLSLTTNQAMNCRNGPGLTYPIITGLDAQTGLLIEGRDAESAWWYVSNPAGGERCWVFGELVNTQGLVDSALVLTPSPAPLAGYDPRFIYYYLVLEDTGGPVACGDSLIAVTTGILRTGDPAEDVRIAISTLFGLTSPYYGGLRHSGYQSNINNLRVTYNKSTQTAHVEAAGTVVKPEDDCDKERFRVQAFTTGKQFDDVNGLSISVRGVPFGDFLVPTN
jgi:hypothetical protein